MQRYADECQSYLEELFSMQRDGDGHIEPVLISEMRLFRLRQCRQKAEQLKQAIADDKGFLMPFLQDERKLKREARKIDLEFEHKKIAFLNDGSTQYSVLKQKKAWVQNEIATIEQDLQRLKSYYKAPAKTKVKVLGLYVGLAVVLSYFFFYAKGIIDTAMQSMT